MIRARLLPPLLLLALVACEEDPAPADPTPAGAGGVAGAAGSGGAGQAGAGQAGTAGQAGSAGSGAEQVSIAFEARVAGEVFSCERTFVGLGAKKTEVEPLDFRLYVHDVRLVTEGGEEVPFALEQDGVWQHENLALLDFEDKKGTCSNGTSALNTTLRGTAPQGTYRGLRFRVGVPFAMNHQDSATAPSPLNLSTMFWSWNAGYKFLRVDTRAVGAGPRNVHLGSTGCQGEGDAVTSCSHPNRPEVELGGFDPLQQKIVVDYAALVATVDLSTDTGGAPGCMSGLDDPECAALFPALGLALESGAPAGGQTFFRVE